jgi:RNA polymerase sigma-32 factor
MAHIDDPRTQKANSDYINSSMNVPMLEREEEQELAKRWTEQGDEKALHQMVSSYTRLVVAIATRFRNYGLPIGDLIQEGNVGLMMAAQRFDYRRDVRFSTYATWWIRSCIQDYVLRNWSIVRTGTTAAQKSLFFNLRRLRAKIENRRERQGLDNAARMEIANDLNVKVSEVEDMETRMIGGDHSLNAPVGENSEDDWQSFLADERANPEDIAISLRDSQTRSQWLREALGGLSAREQKIIERRHLSDEVITLEDLGRELGVSKERVRQLEQRAMIKLKTSISQHAISEISDLFV